MTDDTGRATESSKTSSEKGLRLEGNPRAMSYFDTMPTSLTPDRVGSATGKWRNLHRLISIATSEIDASGGTVCGFGVIHFSTNMVSITVSGVDGASYLSLCLSAALGVSLD